MTSHMLIIAVSFRKIGKSQAVSFDFVVHLTNLH